MSIKTGCVILAVLGILAFGLRDASAAGHGSPGMGAGRGPAFCGKVGNHPGNPGHFPPRNGFVRSANWGYGGLGLGGYGLGYGYGYPDWFYWQYLNGGSVPYFSVFPPVYYGNNGQGPSLGPGAPVPGVAGEMPQPTLETAHVSTSRQPLVIKNPYYYAKGNSETEKPKSDNPPPEALAR